MPAPGPAPGRNKRPRVRPVINVGGGSLTSHPSSSSGSGGGTATAPAPSRNIPGRFAWGGGAARHTISEETHKRNLIKLRADRNPLYDPTQQLSGSNLLGAARDLVGLEFDPQEKALGRELGNVTTQGTALAQRSADYDKQIAQQGAGLPNQVAAIGTLLKGNIDQNATNAQTAINKLLADSQERARTAAQTTGVNTGAGAEGVATEAQAAGDRSAAEGQRSQDAAAAQTANYQQLADLSTRAQAQAGTENQGQLLNRMANQQADVRARQGDLAAERGPATTKAVTDLRQQAFENLITQKGLNIKTDELQAEIANNSANLTEKEKQRRQDARDKAADRDLRATLDKNAADAAATKDANKINEVGISNSEWVKMTPAQRQDAIIGYRKRLADATRPPAKPGKPTPEAASAVGKRSRINSIITDIGTDPKLTHHRYETGPRLVQILVHRGADPLEAQAAAEIARHGVITPDTQKKLEDAGVRIPSRWKGTKAKGRDSQNG